MKLLLKRPSPAGLMALLVLAGVTCALVGVYLLVGLAVTLIVGGVLAAGIGLLVDV